MKKEKVRVKTRFYNTMREAQREVGTRVDIAYVKELPGVEVPCLLIVPSLYSDVAEMLGVKSAWNSRHCMKLLPGTTYSKIVGKLRCYFAVEKMNPSPRLPRLHAAARKVGEILVNFGESA